MPYVGRTPSAVPVTVDDIPANSIDASKIVDGSIELAEIADNSITDAKLNSSKLDGIATSANNYTHPTTHATADIADNAITEAKIADAAVVSLKSGRKNLIINGGFDVSQRGDYTTATSAANGVYTLDRHQSLVDTVGVTFQDLGGELKYAATSSATGRFGFQQRIEEYTKLRGKQVTLSAKVTSNTSDVQLMIYDGSTFTSVNHSGNGSEEILTVTGTLSSSASLARAYVFVSNNNLDVSVTTGDYFSVKELQLELGSVATDFEHRSYGEELALCQRYYCKSYPANKYAGDSWSVGGAFRSTSASNYMNATTFPVTMRTKPSMTYYSPNGTVGKAYGYDSVAAHVNISYWYGSDSNDIPLITTSAGGSTDWYGYNWVADAEL